MRSRIKIVAVYAIFSALWIFGSDRLLAQLVHDPVLLAWIGTVKGLALVGVTSLLLYLLLRLWGGTTKGIREQGTPVPIGNLIALFIGLSLIVPMLGYSIFQIYSPQARENAFADLNAIALLKTDQIESWLAQGQANAELLASDQEFAHAVGPLLRSTGRDAKDATVARVRARLDALRQVYGYDAVVLDAGGRKMLTVGEHGEISVEIKQRHLPLALSSGQVQRSDLYRDASGVIHMDYVVPLLRQGEGTGHAAILLHVPVERFLFPLIQRWPTPSESAETMLVRRDGDQVLYLNELRHQQNTALTLRSPLHGANSPSAMAVRAGQSQHMDTSDRRGIAVLAASRPVVGTEWYVVAKIDRAEVLAPLKRLALWVSLVTLAAVVAVAGAILLLWRQQQRAHRLELIAQSAERDQLLKLFFDLPFVGMSITSPVTKRWRQVNDRLCDMLGHTREELMSLTWAELTHPDDLTADITEFERVLKGEINAYQMDKRFVRKDGATIDTTLNVKAVRYPDGGVEWFVATIQDITAHKQAEQAQKKLSDRIEAMLESMTDGFVALDKDWRYLYANRHAANIIGRDPASLIGKNIWEEFPEGVGQPFYHTYQRVMAQQKPEQIEDYYPPWNRWFENRIYPTADGITIYFQEITERKLMEGTLRESEARFRTIIDTEPECVKMIGPNGKLTFMNRAGLDMIEAENLDQVQGHSVADIVTPEYQEAFRNLTKRVLQGEGGILEFEIIGLKGTRRFLETHAASLREPDGEHFSLLGITRDITEQKKMELQLRQQLAELTRWQEVMLGRENRVQELKREVNDLLIRLGQPIRYPSQAAP